MTASPKTVLGVLDAAAGYLTGKVPDNPRLAAELLAGRLLNCKRLDLYLRHEAEFSEKQLAAMRRGVARVAAGEPVQYVLGEVEFMGHTFKVDARALIPRPETECLVRAVLECAPVWESPGEEDAAAGGRPLIVDLGTGCGCIALSLALERPDAAYVALDVSADALALARENAAAHGLQEKVAFANAEMSDALEADRVSAVVANLPYIRTADYEQLPVHIREHEPRLALDGGADGLAVIGGVVQDSEIALRPGGKLFLEIGADQAQAVTGLLEEAGFEDVSVARDLADRDRIVSGTKS